MMTYQETLAYLYESQPAFHLVGAAAYKPGLDNTIRLMNHLGNPHERFRSVHIAGTNGKGSTSHLIAAALQCAGLKVGLYTSPHLMDFRERIRINGAMIPEEEVVRFVDENRDFLDSVKPSFFESTMAMAFDYFAREQVDIAVIEVGLGGRLDSTNIITPLLSVITNIGLDHTEFLGNTLPAIASEKAGIIKPGIPCVIGETDPLTVPVFIGKSKECGIFGDGLETSNCRLWFADQCHYLATQRERIAPECELKGPYQEKNKQTAFVALRYLLSLPELQSLISMRRPGENISDQIEDFIAEGFAEVCTLTGLRGRWETLSESPLTICDTGHNSHGIRTYVDQLERLLLEHSGNHNASQSPNSHLRIVFGMVSDKDIDVVLSLLPKEALYYWTQGSTHRAIPAAEMRQRGLAHGLIGEAFEPVQPSLPSLPSQPASAPISAVEIAVRAAQAESSSDDIIFIGGSNYVVGEALPLFPKKPLSPKK